MRIGIDLGTAFVAVSRASTRGSPALVGDPVDPRRVRHPVAILLGRDSAQTGCDDPDEDGSLVVAERIKAMLGDRQSTVVDGEGRRWTGERLCAILLDRLSRDAQGDGAEEVEAAVLAIPPHFTPAQRSALRDAAALAGLPAPLIVEDPVACAALGSPGEDLPDEVVLVCDAGYAGFAATLLATSPKGIYVVSTEFTPLAGTRAMDDAVASALKRLFDAQHPEADLSQGNGEIAWRRMAEQFRRALSVPGTSVVRRTALIAERTIDVALTRTQLAKLWGPALDAAEETIALCLAGAALPPRTVQRLLLAGGGAHTALLRARVSKAMGREPDAYPGVEPEHMVALGAGAMAALATPSEDGRLRVPGESAERATGGPLIRETTPFPGRRADLQERLASAPTAGLARAYRAALAELDVALDEVGPPSVFEPSTRVRQADDNGATPKEPDSPEHPGVTQPTLAADFMAAESLRTGVEGDLLEPPVQRRPRRSVRVACTLAGAALVAWGASCIVLVGSEGSGRILRGDRIVRTATGPVALKLPWPFETYREGSEIPAPLVIDDGTSLGATLSGLTQSGPPPAGDPGNSLISARPTSEHAGTSTTAIDRPAVPESPAQSTADEAKRQAEEEAVRIADRAAAATAARAEATARSRAERWAGVPAAERERWRRGLDEASVGLESGSRLLAEGKIEEATAVFVASATNFEVLWAQRSEELRRQARAAFADALAEWDVVFGPVAKEGMSEPAEVANARTRADRIQAEGAAADVEVSTLEQAGSTLKTETARVRAEWAAFDSARRAAGTAKEAFERTPKPSDVDLTGAARGDRLLAMAAETLRTQGLLPATVLCRQAADEFTDASARAAAGAVEREAEAERRALLTELEGLRAVADSLSAARSAAVDRVAQASTNLERLRTQAASPDPQQAEEARNRLDGAAADLAHASRVLLVLGAAGLTDALLDSLRNSLAGAAEAIEKGRDAPLANVKESQKGAEQISGVVGLVDATVRTEEAARSWSERWNAVSAMERDRWNPRLQEPSALLRTGTGLLEGGHVEEAMAALDASAKALHSLWTEYTNGSLQDARSAFAAADAAWNAAFAPCADKGMAEPDEVKQARARALSAKATGIAPESEAPLLREAASVLNTATARLREDRTAVSPPAPDTRMSLIRAVRAGDLAQVRGLLREGADLNAQNDDGETALVEAVRAGHAEIATTLLDAGAERDASAADGRPVAFLATSSPDTLRLFLEGSGKTHFRGRSVLHEIAASGVERKVTGLNQAKMAGMVLERFPGLYVEKDSLGLTALDVARQRDAKELVLFFLQWERSK